MSKKARVFLLGQGKSGPRQDKWKWHIVDVLEVANMECHRVQNQLKIICKGLKYLAKLEYKAYVKGSEGTPSEQGQEICREVEMWEAGVGTSKRMSGGQGSKPEATKVASELRFSNKGKGWEVVDEEETLQEE